MPNDAITLRASEFTPSDISRFWSFVRVGQEDECWPWKGGKAGMGYGKFWWNGVSLRANRVALALKVGAVSGEMLACHSCDNPSCCNPAHLSSGTPASNSGDMVAKQRQAWGDRSSARLYPGLHAGERSSLAKLRASQVAQIREIHAQHPDETYTAIATRYGVTRSAVSRICRGVTWKQAA